MAKLLGEDPSSDVSFEINLKDYSSDKSWRNYEIVFNLGKDKKTFTSIDKIATTYTGIDGQVGKFAFSIQPQNRVELFINLIEKFLDDDQQKTLNYEPADPSFEFILKKSHANTVKAYLWVDHGNTKQLEYSWDASGIRLLSNKEQILQFTNELKQELNS